MRRKRALQWRQGFSMLEMLLVVALIAILGAISIPIYRSILLGNDLQVAREVMVRGLRSAQLSAKMGAHDSAWGVYAQSGSVTIFSGESYETRTADLDMVFEISSQIIFSGDTSILFEKGVGIPASSKTLTLTQEGHEPITISLNTLGAVSY